MRAAVWFLRLLWRAGVRVARRVRFAWLTSPWGPRAPALPVFDELGGQLDGRPRANLAGWMDADPVDVVAEARELVSRYAQTFCGQCSAGPDAPERRCPKCLERLEAVIREAHGDERAKWERVAELAQRGGL